LLDGKLKNEIIISDEQVHADDKLDDDIILEWFEPLKINPIELDAKKAPQFDPNLKELGNMSNLINTIYTAAVIQMSINKRKCLFQKLHDIRDIGDIKREKDTCYVCLEILRAIHAAECKKALKKTTRSELTS
jgi:hypothetical protein